jgi:hypothetical protein
MLLLSNCSWRVVKKDMVDVQWRMLMNDSS